ncbi:GatB/YqeY domain-containing protein [Ectothiorhodospiraceae bacterium BW-2]|nr:GatB/YqeY domain-containing protein [Ectothiorhodospiraceae bacterium BW-2]
MSCDLKAAIQEDMKVAMRNKEKERLGTIRLILAALKQREVDERIELDETQVVAILEKMVKQRRDSIEQYQKAAREDLAAKEQAEIEVIQTYMPQPLTLEEIDRLITEAIEQSGASSMKEMGKVMGLLKPQLQGRAEMGKVSAQIRARLG